MGIKKLKIMKNCLFFLIIVLFGCNSLEKLKDNKKIQVQKGVFIFFGDSDLKYSDLFIQGSFKSNNYLSQLASIDSLRAEEYVLSKKERYSLINKAKMYINKHEFIGYTNGSKEIYLLPITIKVKPPEKYYYDPTNIEKTIEILLDDYLITFKSLYTKNEFIEVVSE